MSFNWLVMLFAIDNKTANRKFPEINFKKTDRIAAPLKKS